MSATGMPGCSVSPSRISGTCWPKLMNAAAILPDRHQPGHRRQRLASARCAAVRAARRAGCGCAAAGTPPAANRACSFRAAMSVSSCCSARFCLLQHQHVLLAVDLGDDRVALDFELRAAHVVPRLQQRHLVLALLDRQIRLGLLDLLVHRLHARAALPRAPPAARESSYSTIRSFSLASAPTGASSVTCTVPIRFGAISVWARTARSSPRENARITTSPFCTLVVGNGVLPLRHFLIETVAAPAGPRQNRQADQHEKLLFSWNAIHAAPSARLYSFFLAFLAASAGLSSVTMSPSFRPPVTTTSSSFACRLDLARHEILADLDVHRRLAVLCRSWPASESAAAFGCRSIMISARRAHAGPQPIVQILQRRARREASSPASNRP